MAILACIFDSSAQLLAMIIACGAELWWACKYMRQKFYDSYYRALDLEPGASLDDIDRMWHLLVQVWHPDRLPPGTAVYQHAVRRMQDINVARDELRAYWKAHGQAPPVGSTGSTAAQAASAAGARSQRARSSAPPNQQSPPPNSAPPPPQGARGQRRGSPPPNPSPPPPETGAGSGGAAAAAGGSPAASDIPSLREFEKTWIHHVFDWMDRNQESNPGLAVAFGFVLLVASFGLARMALLPFWPMDYEFTNQDSMVVLVVAFIIFGLIFRLIFASYEVYKLLEKPYFEAVPVSPDVAAELITRSLLAARYEDQVWSVETPATSGTTNGARTIVAKMRLGEATVTLHARIWPSHMENWSVIGLEFDADHPWRIPAPYAPVRLTNEAIAATLNGRRW